jgi:membrane protein
VSSSVDKTPQRAAAPSGDGIRTGETARLPWTRRAARLASATARSATDDRVSRLAAEVAFFALLALPPTMLAVLGSIGYIADAFGPGIAGRLQQRLLQFGGTFLTPSTVSEIVRPAVVSMLHTGRAHLVWFGAVFALWPASRATAVIIDAMRIAYSVDAPARGWKRRLTALGLTAATTLGVVLLLPVLVAGPRLASFAEPLGLDQAVAATWLVLYWPLMGILGLALLSIFYRFAISDSISWRKVLPGAALALVVWLLGGLGVRAYAGWAMGSTTAYGPFAAPLVLMLWLYVTGLAVLLGAELNGALFRVARTSP